MVVKDMEMCNYKVMSYEPFCTTSLFFFFSQNLHSERSFTVLHFVLWCNNSFVLYWILLHLDVSLRSSSAKEDFRQRFKSSSSFNALAVFHRGELTQKEKRILLLLHLVTYKGEKVKRFKPTEEFFS